MQRAYVFFIMFWESLLFGLQSVHVYTRAAVDRVGVCGASLPPCHTEQTQNYILFECLQRFDVYMCTIYVVCVCCFMCGVCIGALCVYAYNVLCGLIGYCYVVVFVGC
jgi:hypothetical protein